MGEREAESGKAQKKKINYNLKNSNLSEKQRKKHEILLQQKIK